MTIIAILKDSTGWYCKFNGHRVYGFPTYLEALEYARRLRC